MVTGKAIVIGASSGIGRELAHKLGQQGYEVGLTARRVDKLEALRNEIPTRGYVKQMDLREPETAREILQELLSEMHSVDLIILNAGVGLTQRADWEQEKRIIDVNVTGFVALANVAMDYFRERGEGHLVGISSIAGLKGFGRNASYCASKAFISNYMQGLRQQSFHKKLNIVITDIKPGFVDTPLTQKRRHMFWVASADEAARQIYSAIEKRRSHAYVTRRWRLAAWLLRAMPEWLFLRLPG